MEIFYDNRGDGILNYENMQNRRERMTADNIIPQIVDFGRLLIESSLDTFRRVNAVVRQRLS